jgi:hypothetical protein
MSESKPTNDTVQEFGINSLLIFYQFVFQVLCVRKCNLQVNLSNKTSKSENR